MPKTKKQLEQELEDLKALILNQTKPTTTQTTTGGTAGFKVTRNVAKSTKFGIEYCLIHFVDANGKGIPGAPTKEDTLGFEAKAQIKAARYGDMNRGKFRWDRTNRAWSGQSAFVPQIVLDNLVK